MVDRFLDFLDRPMSRDAAKAVFIFGAAVCFGYMLVALLSVGGDGDAQLSAAHPDVRHRAVSANPAHSDREPAAASVPQDPQDRPGSAAARAARAELRGHRALQHVPYRAGGVVITLAGARRGRAVLRVSATTRPSARRGWRRFLARFGDAGRAYVPVFEVEGAHRG